MCARQSKRGLTLLTVEQVLVTDDPGRETTTPVGETTLPAAAAETLRDMVIGCDKPGMESYLLKYKK